MNKIRYRAFDKHMKTMGEVTSIKFFEHMYDHVSVRFTVKGKTIDESYNIGYDGGDNIILMQDTGLKDKNGTRVFEGDVLVFNGDRFVIFRDEERGGFYMNYWQFDEQYDLNEFWPTSEIIDNIHVNPELMGDSAAQIIQDAKEGLTELGE